MWSFTVVVGYPLHKNRPKMPFVERNHPIETLAPCRPDEAFTVRVRLWCPHRRLQHLQGHRPKGLVPEAGASRQTTKAEQGRFARRCPCGAVGPGARHNRRAVFAGRGFPPPVAHGTATSVARGATSQSEERTPFSARPPDHNVSNETSSSRLWQTGWSDLLRKGGLQRSTGRALPGTAVDTRRVDSFCRTGANGTGNESETLRITDRNRNELSGR